jgi:hypothetical protein
MSDNDMPQEYPEYEGQTIVELAEALKKAQEELDFLRKAATALQARVDCLRLVVLPKVMEETGVTSCTISGIGRISVTHDLYAAIRADHREEAFTWLRENGYESLIVPTVNAQTLRAWAKEQIRSGGTIPPSVTVMPFTRASITKG